MSSTNGAILSAKNIFFKKPNAISVIPAFRFLLSTENNRNLEFFPTSEIFSLSCGKKFDALIIGPATNCGKNETNNANSKNDLHGSNFRL